MFVKKYGDICVSIFYIAAALVMIVAARALPKSTVMDIGPDFMPLVVGVVTLILAVALLITTLINFKKNAAAAEAAGAPDCDYVRVLSSFIAILIYVFVLQPVGFILSTVVFLPVEMWILSPNDKRGLKDTAILALIGVVFTFAVFFLFRYGFKIVLPAGIFTINL
ncbi:MAG: tripartite tricarboxylate transporter TctB family protein [Lachnospiraceae bacterium]